MTQFLFKRSGTADKRPDPLQMALGEVDLNYDDVTGGLFYKDGSGNVIKVGPAQVSATAPNDTPAGSAGNALGEFWYNTGSATLCIWDGSSWVGTGGGTTVIPATPTTFGTVLGTTDNAGFNTALGEGAFSNCDTATGERNTFIGAYGGASALTSASCNSGVGQGIFGSLTSGSNNSAFGNADSLGFLTTGNHNSAFGAAALQKLTTGGINVGIGACAGCDITTGSCNVALGPNAQVASATGDCQLAIGFSSTANWLTGDSTKAIKPGAGILDCNNSTGTAGQFLSSTGANALAWCTPDYITPTALTSSSVGALIVNGYDYGGDSCYISVLPGPAAPGQILTYAYDSGNPAYLSGQGYLNWCTPNYISQSSFGPGALVVGCTPGSTGGICTVGSIINANSPGVSAGYYQGVTVTTCSGAGSGALANVNVISTPYFPSVDSVEIVQPGIGYALADSVGFQICGTTITTTGSVCSLNQSTVCKAGYLSVGTDGQVLTADSSCALGVKWGAASGGSGIPCACITGQGALITGTAASTPATLAVGTAGQVLTVDLACASGLKWATPSIASAATPTVAGIVLGRSTATVTALGCNALLNTTTGDNNTAVGCGALRFNVTGENNTAVGDAAGSSITGSGNTIVGALALASNTGNNSTAIGQSALAATTGAGNTALGWNAGTAVTTGANNVILGPVVSGFPPYTPFDETGSCQLAIGFGGNCYWITGTSTKAIRPGAGIIDCAGSCGTAGQILTSNGSNAICWTTVSGVAAATPTVSGSVLGCTVTNLTALGCNAGVVSTGAGNVAIGNSALCTNTTSTCNTAIGDQSLLVSTGCQNVSVGALALCALATGNDNVAIGTGSGLNLTSGNLNVAIGSGVQFASATGSCQLAIGYSPTANWLTGDSTKAIKPGAGIIDCTGSCGNAGQYLCSSGSNSVVWATPPNPWITCAAYKETVTNGTKICVIGWPSEESTTWSGQMSISTTYDDGQSYWVPGSNAIIMINGFMGGGTSTIQSFSTASGTFAVEGVAYGSQSDVTVTFTPSINATRMNFYIGYMDLSLTGNPFVGFLTTNVTAFTPPVARPL